MRLSILTSLPVAITLLSLYSHFTPRRRASQHTNKSHAELYVLVHTPTMAIHALAAIADFHTPWTAGQFHHMVHSSQEDRMFFFGRRSEASLMPR